MNYDYTIKVWKGEDGNWIAHLSEAGKFNDVQGYGDTPKKAIHNAITRLA